MNNNLLDFDSIVQGALQQEADLYDEYLEDDDDGEARDVKESRDIILSRLDGSIEKLNELKFELATTSIKKLRSIYNLNDPA